MTCVLTATQRNDLCHTPRQAAAIEQIATRLGLSADDVWIEASAFDLPPRWVLVTAGTKKGRAQVFGVSPEGRVST